MAENRAEIKTRKMAKSDMAKVNDIDRSLYDKKRVTTWPFSFDIYWRVYGPKLCYVAELEGNVVGFIAGVIEHEERSKYLIRQPHGIAPSSLKSQKIGWIEMMGVHADHWGKGAGGALINAFSDECKKNNATMRIVIRDDDENLKIFLSRLNFKQAETVSFERAPE
ncbi:GNAT family N-acetyltransferase [Chloroflexota bacterium]